MEGQHARARCTEFCSRLRAGAYRVASGENASGVHRQACHRGTAWWAGRSLGEAQCGEESTRCGSQPDEKLAVHLLHPGHGGVHGRSLRPMQA